MLCSHANNRFLHGLSGAVVLYQYFCSIEGIACGSTKYVTQWHLVSQSSKRSKTKFFVKLHCPLVNFRNNWSFYLTKERFPRQKFRHWHCFTSSSTHKGRVWEQMNMEMDSINLQKKSEMKQLFGQEKEKWSGH